MVCTAYFSKLFTEYFTIKHLLPTFLIIKELIMSRKLFSSFLRSMCLILVLVFAACSSNDDNLYYTGSKASFTYSPVENSPLLLRALRNSGEFAIFLNTVYNGSMRFVISNAQGAEETIQGTSVDYYKSMYFGLSNGFIIGMPTLPEVGVDITSPVCFDVVCPNCYNNYSICKRLSLREGGYAFCGSCSRIYNLNNYGIVSDGEGGRNLFRYHITASGSTMSIYN